MQQPKFPKNEVARLEKLNSLQILDQDSDERFDRVTRMAKRLFDVPTAVVSLVDASRQWALSTAGGERSEAPRAISFCGHTILEDEMLIVENTLNDERFVDNPLVTDPPDLRFYAGYPLKTNGYTLGTLCLIDQKPRQFTGDDISALKDLGSLVEQALETTQLATLDDLTKLSNRRGFMVHCESALGICAVQKRPATLMFVDLDNFKPINDQLGHAAGDEVLLDFANMMKDTFREYDLVARLGGDEFVALFSGTTKNNAEQLLSRLQAKLAQYNTQSDRAINLDFSYGIVEFDPARHTSSELLIAEGDELMYQLKQSKK